MTPELRNWYLSNLGIVQYVPRGEGPVSLQFHSSQPEEQPQPNASQVKKQVASVLELVKGQAPSVVSPEDRPHIGDILPEAPEKKPISTERVRKEALAAGEVSAPALLHFRLACWHPCDDLLVFNPLSPGAQPDAVQNNLLSNILRAIGRLPNGLPLPEFIDWPVGNAHVSQRAGMESNADKEGAKAMLSVFLDARIKKHGVLWVLLMGELATELLSTNDKPYGDILCGMAEITGGAKIVVVRSLQEMLAEPLSKGDTWQALQHLVRKH
jgi:hypothetical protein